MAKIAKWIGLGFGWAFLGPIGGILGFAAGYYIDNNPGLIKSSIGGPTTPGDFIASLLVLIAAVMKADGVVRRVELNYVKGYLVKTFGEDSALEAIRLLRDILQKDIPIRDVSVQIAKNLDYSSRLQLLHFLFGISNSDGEIHPDELKMLEAIATHLEISNSDYHSLRSTFLTGIESAYDTLGISTNAPIEEIKSAYRKMANKYHPDKVAYLGEEFRIAAEEKFTKLNEAYEQVKRERGFY